MDSLKELRKEINQIDHNLTELYEKRMHLMRSIAKIKLQNNLPILDVEREKDVIEKNSDLLEDDSLRPLFVDFITLIMNQGKLLQQELIENSSE